MARFDGLAACPELMPYLLQAASRPAAAAAARGLHALYRVVKLQASRRRLALALALTPTLTRILTLTRTLTLILTLTTHHSPLTTHHSTLTLTLTLTLQASRRLLPHRKQFFALAAELLLRLQPLQQLYVEGLLRELGQQPPEQAAAWLGLS